MRPVSETSPLSSYVRDWRPAATTARDVIAPAPATALARLLDRADDALAEGCPLPALWHWLYFLDWPLQADLGADGHPARGHFLPPIPGRTRMFAGGRLRVRAPIEIGPPAARTSEVAGVTVKEGRTGEMLFVTVRHEIRQGGEPLLVEEQDLVYRSTPGEAPASRPGPAESRDHPPVPGEGALHQVERPESPPAPSPPWRVPFTADPVMLFRFSALTANAHRIHYDQPYTRDVEHHPGLVVHGPLLAILMAELPRLHAPERRIAALTYRFRRPVFAGEPVLVSGGPSGDGTAAALLSVTGPTAAGATGAAIRAEARVTFA